MNSDKKCLLGRQKILLIACILVGVILPPAPAATLYVATTGSDSNDGSSWTLALRTISNAVARTGDGLVTNTVLVSNGTYTLSAQIIVTNGLTIRSWHDGALDSTNTCLNGNYNATTNRCLLLSNANAVVEGFTLSNGYPSASDNNGYGGGIYIYQGGVRSCRVMFNTGSSRGGGVYMVTNGASLQNCEVSLNRMVNADGGGIFIIYGGTVLNSVISYNSARLGGGMACNGNVIVSNCAIIGNASTNTTVSQGGGGIYIGNAFIGRVVVDNCRVISNTAATNYGGGIFTLVDCLLTNCVVAGNSTLAARVGGAANGGGGVYIYAAVTIANCSIQSNSTADFGGGVIFVANAPDAKNILNSTIADNTAYSGGGAYIYRNGIIRNCLVTRNVADTGGGMYLGANVDMKIVENCTIVSNRAYGHWAGGLYVDLNAASTAQVQNCIIASNLALSVAWGHDWWTNTARLTFSNCCTTSNSTQALPGSGNLTNNPGLVSVATNNFRLLPFSPCINAGLTMPWMEGASDLDGRRRVDRFSGKADMGAYEYISGGVMIRVR